MLQHHDQDILQRAGQPNGGEVQKGEGRTDWAERKLLGGELLVRTGSHSAGHLPAVWLQVKASGNTFKSTVSGVKGGDHLMLLAGWKTQVCVWRQQECHMPSAA